MAYNDKILQLHRYSSQKSEKWTENMANEEPPSSPSRCCDLSFCFLCSPAVHKKQKFSRSKYEQKKKIYVSIKYILSLLYIWPGQMKMVMCHENFSFVHLGVKYRCWNRQSLRGIIHGCFQVCKHLISCILRCARRDHLGHICCKLKHFKFEATLCRNRLQQEGRTCLQ